MRHVQSRFLFPIHKIRHNEREHKSSKCNTRGHIVCRWCVNLIALDRISISLPSSLHHSRTICTEYIIQHYHYYECHLSFSFSNSVVLRFSHFSHFLILFSQMPGDNGCEAIWGMLAATDHLTSALIRRMLN